VETISLSGEYTHVYDVANSNGIVANADGSWLLIVNMANGDLYKVNPAGMSHKVDVKDESGEPYQMVGGDGMVLCGESRLVVVLGTSNKLVVVTLGQVTLA
jgi:hypothetical protein